MQKCQRLFDILRRREEASRQVYGRKEELCAIQDAFDRVSEMDSPSSELVLIHGPSGCGKSSIVKAFLDWTRQERDDVRVLCGSGKYDQFVNNEPFAAIVSASNELCKAITTTGTNRIKQFNDHFQNMVKSGQNKKVLTNAIPWLATLLEGDQESLADEQLGSLPQAFTRFKQLWRSFLLAAATCSDVTVLFLDDVQWADSNSLDLINTLTKVTQARNILFICAYRDDTSVDNIQAERLRWCFSLDDGIDSHKHEPSRRLNGGDLSKLTVPMTDISLGNLDGNRTNELVCGLLYGNASESTGLSRNQQLSEVMFARTGGNPFFILYYLNYLSTIHKIATEDDGVTWQWNFDSIESHDESPQSIAELLERVIEVLPTQMKTTLTIGAHVGFEFSASVLEHELLDIGEPQESETAPPRSEEPTSHVNRIQRRSSSGVLYRNYAHSVLDAAVREGLLERKANLTYAFPHDQIQRALYMTLVDSPQLQKRLHLKIGRALIESISVAKDIQMVKSSSSSQSTAASRSDRALFIAVDNLNKGSGCIDNSAEQRQLVALNFEAARAALQKSALENAVNYSRSAILLLDRDCWENDYESTLSLYSLAARLEHCSGNYQGCTKILSEIQSKAWNILDKLPSYFTEIDSLGAQGQLDDALKLGIRVLRQLGEPMPSRPTVIHLALELIGTSKLFKRTSLLELSPMENPAKIAAMSVLSSLSMYSYIAGSKARNLFGMIVIRMLRISCIHGIAQHTPGCVAGYAVILNALNDVQQSKTTGELANELNNTVEGVEAAWGRTHQILNAMVFPWMGSSLEKLHPEYLRSHHACMAYGDVDYAFYAIVQHLFCSIFRGTRLDDLHSEFNKYLQDMDEYGVHHAKHCCVGLWQCVRMLLGLDPQRTCPSDTLDVSHLFAEMKTTPTELTGLVYYEMDSFGRIVLGSFGRETLLDDELKLQQIGRRARAQRPHFGEPFYHLVRGLGYLELLKQTNKRKHRRNGRKALRALKFLNDTRNAPVVVAPHKLLQAELLQSPEAFLDAVETAQATGNLPVEAMSCERLAQCLRMNGSIEQSTIYIDRATELYRRWGALEKVKTLSR